MQTIGSFFLLCCLKMNTKRYFYVERILSIIPMRTWAGELTSTGVDTLLRHFAAMTSVLCVQIPSGRESVPPGSSHLRGQPIWLLHDLCFSRALGWHLFVCLLPLYIASHRTRAFIWKAPMDAENVCSQEIHWGKCVAVWDTLFSPWDT